MHDAAGAYLGQAAIVIAGGSPPPRATVQAIDAAGTRPVGALPAPRTQPVSALGTGRGSPPRRPAQQATPFDQLLPFNGGIDRETGLNEIDTAFNITFFGSTVSGHRVQSETASGIMLFRFLGAAATRTAK